jgi:type III pantothenate kinase
MLLAIDVGNTETKLGFFEGAELRRTWRVTSATRRTADEFGVLFAALFRRAEIPLERVGAIVISSVVPQNDLPLSEACRQYFDVAPEFFRPAEQTLLEVTTERPREVGADLVAAAIGARAAYGAPLIVIGYGTATTFSALTREGEFVGAAIAPGIQISLDALVGRTAKLPQVSLEVPNGPIGRDTVAALQAGIVYGFVGQTEGIVARFKHAVGEDAQVVATGGLAEVIAKHTAAIDAVEPHLVLQGLQLYHASPERRG